MINLSFTIVISHIYLPECQAGSCYRSQILKLQPLTPFSRDFLKGPLPLPPPTPRWHLCQATCSVVSAINTSAGLCGYPRLSWLHSGTLPLARQAGRDYLFCTRHFRLLDFGARPACCTGACWVGLTACVVSTPTCRITLGSPSHNEN